MPASLLAQSADTAPSLDDLIPQGAVENPEEWAADTSEIPQDETVADPVEALVLDLEPFEAEAANDLADLKLAPFEPLAAEEPIEFADLEVTGPALVFSEAEQAVITDQLVLAFPQSDPPFTERDEFVERFKALSTIRELRSGQQSSAQIAAQARADEELLANLLRTYGYYDGQVVRVMVQDAPAGEAGQPQVRFSVIPGSRYRFGAINLGALSSALDAEFLRSRFGLNGGDFVQGDQVLEERAALDTALGETGYPFAEIDDPALLVDHAREEADLTLPVRPGGKYVFGSIISSDPKFLPGDHLETIARFDADEVYKRSELFDLRRAVTATGLVSSVTVTPREVTSPQGDEPGVVALDVGIERGKLRTIAGAIGYGSEEGVRLQASWEHRNLFPPEGALKLRGVLGTQEQLGGISLRKSNFGGRDRILNVDAFVSKIDSPAFDANTLGFVASYERLSTFLFQKKSSWSVGLELLATEERPPEVANVVQPRETFLVAALPAYAQYDTSDDLLDPTRGVRLSGRLSPEISRNRGRESTYIRGRFDLAAYNQVSDGVIVAGRLAFGAIPGAELNRIAPSRRLYAGGGGSVRGFGFREIGPRDDAGEPSGGRSVVEGAIEARIRTGLLEGAVSVVPFIDAGSVSPSVRPDFNEIKVGAGLGLRYNSGFGSLRLDVGVPLNPDPDDNPVAVYVSLGQAF